MLVVCLLGEKRSVTFDMGLVMLRLAEVTVRVRIKDGGEFEVRLAR